MHLLLHDAWQSPKILYSTNVAPQTSSPETLRPSCASVPQPADLLAAGRLAGILDAQSGAPHTSAGLLGKCSYHALHTFSGLFLQFVWVLWLVVLAIVCPAWQCNVATQLCLQMEAATVRVYGTLHICNFSSQDGKLHNNYLITCLLQCICL